MNNLNEIQMQSHISLSNVDFKSARDVTEHIGVSKQLCDKCLVSGQKSLL